MVAVGCRNLCAVGHHPGDGVSQVRNRGARNALAAQLEPVAKRLEARAEELATRQVQGMRANFSTYRTDRTVPDAPLIASALRNVGRVVTTLREGRAPTPEEVHEAWVARERTEQGVPTTEQITGYRFVQRLLADAVIEQAETLGLDQKIITQ